MLRRQASSAYQRKQNAHRMERRDRTTATSANGLLTRQFASITSVLVQASQRRNQELQQRELRLVRTPPTFKPASGSPVVTEPELSQGSDSGDDRIELEQGNQSKDTVDDELMVAASTKQFSDVSDTQVHLRGGYLSDSPDDVKRTIAALYSSAPKLADSSFEQRLDDNRDRARMLADLENFSSTTKTAAIVRHNDPEPILAGANMDEEDKLSTLAERLGVDSTKSAAFGDTEATLDHLNDQEQASGAGHLKNEDDDLEALRGKLATTFPPSCDMASQDSLHTTKDAPPDDLAQNIREDVGEKPELECAPSAVIFRLGAGRAMWEDVQIRCTQPSSDNMDEQEARREKEEMVKRENEKLEATIKYVLEEEKRYREIEEQKRLSTRLIVSNLAADVDDNAIRMFFAEYHREIRNITILSKRDPVKRTRTAYVDFHSRKMAVCASYEVGGIYGLIVKTKLAVE